jgi:hypothetical protein
MLGLVAAGLIVFALFSLVEARFPSCERREQPQPIRGPAGRPVDPH